MASKLIHSKLGQSIYLSFLLRTASIASLMVASDLSMQLRRTFDIRAKLPEDI